MFRVIFNENHGIWSSIYTLRQTDRLVRFYVVEGGVTAQRPIDMQGVEGIAVQNGNDLSLRILSTLRLGGVGHPSPTLLAIISCDGGTDRISV